MADRIDPPVKAVAFDFDGVITNLSIDWKDAIRKASQIAGYNVKSLLTFYETCHGTDLFRKVSVEMEKLELEAAKTAQPKPALEDLLRNLKTSQIPLFIVTMQSQKPIHAFLSQHRLSSYFSGIITREDCPNKVAQIQCAAKHAGLHPSQILLVDDHWRNIEKCKELGAVCLQVKTVQSQKEAKETWGKILKLVGDF